MKRTHTRLGTKHTDLDAALSAGLSLASASTDASSLCRSRQTKNWAGLARLTYVVNGGGGLGRQGLQCFQQLCKFLKRCGEDANFANFAERSGAPLERVP